MKGLIKHTTEIGLSPKEQDEDFMQGCAMLRIMLQSDNCDDSVKERQEAGYKADETF